MALAVASVAPHSAVLQIGAGDGPESVTPALAASKEVANGPDVIFECPVAGDQKVCYFYRRVFCETILIIPSGHRPKPSPRELH